MPWPRRTGKETLDAAEFVRIVGIGKGGKPLDSVDSEE